MISKHFDHHAIILKIMLLSEERQQGEHITRLKAIFKYLQFIAV